MVHKKCIKGESKVNPLIVLTPIGYFIRVARQPGTTDEQDLRLIGTNDNEYYALLKSELDSLNGSLEDLERLLLAFAKRHGLLAYRKDRSTDTRHPHYSRRYGCVLIPLKGEDV